eukprot:SAG11_NODE_119_length_15911_cov_7.077599_11_plen_79_part_00
MFFSREKEKFMTCKLVWRTVVPSVLNASSENSGGIGDMPARLAIVYSLQHVTYTIARYYMQCKCQPKYVLAAFVGNAP